MNAHATVEGPFAHGLRQIGYCDLGGRSAFKMAIREHEGRWWMYTSTFWEPGYNIIDITDPTRPTLVRHVVLDLRPPLVTLQVQVAGDLMITSIEAVDIPGEEKRDHKAPVADEGFIIWSLEHPDEPKRLGQFRTGGRGTHRNFYAGGRYVYATGLPEGYDGHILQIVDIVDPSHPVEVSRWWLPGQWVAGGERGAVPNTLLHGGAYVRGNRAYLPYSAGGFVILDVSDVRSPKQVGVLPFSPPFVSNIAVHTAPPLDARPLVIVNSEPVAEDGTDAMDVVGMVDVSNESSPRLVALFPLPAPPPGAPYKNFYQKGGRFGPHNQHQWQGQPALLHDENRVFLSYFNARLRVYDIRDERMPREIAYFVPRDPETRLGPLPRSRLVCQTEDVIVDARRNIFISDKNQGIHVLRLDDALHDP
jgi:hypothetical protein